MNTESIKQLGCLGGYFCFHLYLLLRIAQGLFKGWDSKGEKIPNENEENIKHTTNSGIKRRKLINGPQGNTWLINLPKCH